MVVELARLRAVCALVLPHLDGADAQAVRDFLAESDAEREERIFWAERGPGELMERVEAWWVLLEELCPGLQSPIVPGMASLVGEPFWEGHRLLGHFLRAERRGTAWAFLPRAIREIRRLIWYSCGGVRVRHPDSRLLGALLAATNVMNWEIYLQEKREVRGLAELLGFAPFDNSAKPVGDLAADGGIATWQPKRRPIVLAESQDGEVETLKRAVEEVADGGFKRSVWLTDLSFLGLAYRRAGGDPQAGDQIIWGLERSYADREDEVSDVLADVLDACQGHGLAYYHKGRQ